MLIKILRENADGKKEYAWADDEGFDPARVSWTLEQRYVVGRTRLQDGTACALRANLGPACVDDDVVPFERAQGRVLNGLRCSWAAKNPRPSEERIARG